MIKKNTFYALVAATALSAVSLSVVAGGAEPLPPAPVVSPFVGPFVGANAGFIAGYWDWNQSDYLDFTQSYQDISGIGGLQLGYNLAHGNFLYGIEGDVDYSGLDDSNTSNFLDDSFSVKRHNELNWLGLLDLRGGILSGDTLFYIMGGAAFGGVSASLKAECGTDCSETVFDDSKTSVGWNIGGGVEHLITNKLSIGARVVYIDLGTETYHDSTTNSEETPLGLSEDVSTRAVTGQLVLNYIFNGLS